MIAESAKQDKNTAEFWETMSEDDEFRDASDAATDVEVVSDAATIIISELQMPKPPSTAAQFESTGIAVRTEDPVTSSAAAIELLTKTQVVSLADETVTSASDQGPTATDTTIFAKSPGPIADILSTRLELRLTVRSTPVDILWWVLTGLLLAVVCSRL
ncbi:hypothetical protein B0H19DRAFT_1170994, partial [Mycena capillaripes]